MPPAARGPRGSIALQAASSCTQLEGSVSTQRRRRLFLALALARSDQAAAQRPAGSPLAKWVSQQRVCAVLRPASKGGGGRPLLRRPTAPCPPLIHDL